VQIAADLLAVVQIETGLMPPCLFQAIDSFWHSRRQAIGLISALLSLHSSIGLKGDA
jgi:hypothetical protein